MEEKDDWTCGREGDRHPFTQTNLQDEFVTPIILVLNYMKFCVQSKHYIMNPLMHSIIFQHFLQKVMKWFQDRPISHGT